MFDVLDRPKVWIPIYWPGLAPSDVEGEVAKVVEHRIDVLVELLDREPLIELFELDEPGVNRPATAPRTAAQERQRERDVFTRLVSDWRRVFSGGKPVPFNPENVDKMLKINNFPTAFTTAYLQACGGKVETRAGN